MLSCCRKGNRTFVADILLPLNAAIEYKIIANK